MLIVSMCHLIDGRSSYVCWKCPYMMMYGGLVSHSFRLYVIVGVVCIFTYKFVAVFDWNSDIYHIWFTLPLHRYMHWHKLINRKRLEMCVKWPYIQSELLTINVHTRAHTRYIWREFDGVCITPVLISKLLNGFCSDTPLHFCEVVNHSLNTPNFYITQYHLYSIPGKSVSTPWLEKIYTTEYIIIIQNCNNHYLFQF